MNGTTTNGLDPDGYCRECRTKHGPWGHQAPADFRADNAYGIAVTLRDPSEPGALAGYFVTCEACGGYSPGSDSFETNAKQLAADHLDWHGAQLDAPAGQPANYGDEFAAAHYSAEAADRDRWVDALAIAGGDENEAAIIFEHYTDTERAHEGRVS